MSVSEINEKPRVFISHCHHNRDDAIYLDDVLRDHDAETFLDEYIIEPGDELPQRLRNGIEWCKIFLLLWSSSAAKSRWVDKEWHIAHESEKKIIPYLLDTTSLPDELATCFLVDFKDQHHENTNLLTAVFGKHIRSLSPYTLFPGNWCVQTHADRSGKIYYDLELQSDGHITGTGEIGTNGFSDADKHHKDKSDGHRLSLPVNGCWTYNEREQVLTLDITAIETTNGHHYESIRVYATGREHCPLNGKDFRGRLWTLKRKV